MPSTFARSTHAPDRATPSSARIITSSVEALSVAREAAAALAPEASARDLGLSLGAAVKAEAGDAIAI